MATKFEHAYVLNVLSDDHPGIVAAVCEAVADLEGNIDSCSQTVVGGYFTLIMIVSLPVEIPPEQLAERVRAGGTGLQVVARRPAAAGRQGQAGTGRFIVTVVGPDRPGIVRGLSNYFGGKDINITDLFGQRQGEDFVVICEVEIPDRCEIGMLQAELAALGSETGVRIRLQHENVFVATNQLRLSRQT